MAATHVTPQISRFNLALFQATRDQLTTEQRFIFPACFIGVLSNFVSEETWQRAIETATTSATVLCPLPQTEEKGE